MNFLKHLILSALVLLSLQSFAQGVITGAGSYSGTTVGQGDDCTLRTALDYTYDFTPAVSGSWTFSLCSTSPTWDSYIYVRTGPGCGTSTVNFDDDGCAPLSTVGATLTAGTAYSIVIEGFDNLESGAFTLVVTGPPTPPANDECANATAFPTIPTDGTCVTLSAQSTSGASNSNVTPTGSCTTNSGTPDDDVWFSFVAPGPNVTLQATLVSGNSDVYWQVFSSACGSSMVSILCTDNNGGATLTGLTTGATYYIRLYTWAASVVTSQDICLRTPPPPPANDECAGAVSLTPQAFVASGCPGSVSGTTVAATQTTTPPSTNWPSSGDDDVWYSFTATQTSHIIRFCNVTYPVGTAVAMSIELHPDCASAAIAGSGLTATITSGTGQATLTGLTSGVNYRLRVLTSGTTSRANFDISVLEPQGMTYVSSTATQQTGAVSAGAVNQQIIRADVVVIGLINPINVTELVFNTNGSTAAADLLNAKVFYTGTSTTFATTTPFGSVIANPNGTLSFTGSQVLTGGAANTTNYFWLAYDLQCSATNTNVIDGEFNSVTVGGSPQTPTTQAPTGNRAISGFTTATNQPLTTSVGAGSTNVQVLRVDVTGSAACGQVTQLNLATTGSTNPAGDLAAARVFYTGTSTTFATTTQFGTDISAPSGSITFNGNQTLAAGTNYFWLVYDITCSAVNANVVDGASTSVVYNGATLTPTTSNPTGTRAITALTSYDTKAIGNWSDANTWACGVPPSGTTIPININHNVTLDVNVDVQATVTVAASRTLAIGSNTLSIGAAGTGTQNLAVNGTVNISGGTLNVGTATGVTTSNITVASGATLNNNGGTINLGPSGGYNRTLSVTGIFTNNGTTNVNGSAAFNTNSTFNMSSGLFQIDGNSGVSGTSVASGTRLLSFGTASTGIAINCSGGTIRIVDPPFTGTGLSVGVGVSSSNVPATSFVGCTFEFGDGASTQTGTSSGFLFDTYINTKNVPLGDVVVNAGSGSTRFVSGTTLSGNASDIQGTLTVNAGCEIRSASSAGIGVYGNITNNGTISITSASSGVLFLGGRQVASAPPANTAQTISGGGVWRNSTTTATANIHSITMNNAGGTTFSIPLTVGSTLTLTTGRIFTDATNYIGVGTGIQPSGTIGTGTVSGGSNGSHVVGVVRKAIPSATTWTTITDQRGLFPLGDGTTYRPLNLAVTTAVSAAGTLAGAHLTTDPDVPASPYTDGGQTIETTSPTGFWNIEYANGAAGGVYNVQANATGFSQRGGGTITLFANLRLIKRSTGGSWVSGADGTPTAPTGLAAITRNGCTTFSDFAVGGSFLALPLELTYFNGKTLASSNLLSWETAIEKDVQWHIVERAADGVNFTEVGRMAGQLVSSAPKKYELEDQRPIGKAYYRLRSIDLDGKASLSSVIILERKGARFQIDQVFPSPTQGNLTVQFNALEESAVNVMVHDFSGRLVLQQQMDAAKGFNQTSLELGSLPAGMYNVTILGTQSATEPVRIVKE